MNTNINYYPNLKQYLNLSDINSELYISDELSFHWMNYINTCQALKSSDHGFNMVNASLQIEQKLAALKSITVWVRNRVTVKAITLYQLYESYLDNRIRLNWFNRAEEILYSNTSENGPYSSISLMKWFKFEEYELFVIKKIILNNYPMRSFRLNAKIPLTLFLDNNEKISNEIFIHQLTEQGIILRFNNKNALLKVFKSKFALIEMNLSKYINDGSKSNYNFKVDLNKIINNNDTDFLSRSMRPMEFIYLKYSDIFPLDHHHSLDQIFGKIVREMKEKFTNELNKKNENICKAA